MPARRTRLLAAIAALALCGADEPAKDGLDIYFIDVMGGAATLIVTPERESILLDSGWPGFDDRDPKRIVRVLKEVAGLERLDHLVTTHWHVDHYGGVEGLARLVEVGRYWDRGLPDADAPEDSAAYPDGPKPGDKLGDAYRRVTQGKRTQLKAGDTLPLKGRFEALVLASGAEVISPGAPLPPDNPLCADAPPDKDPDRSDNARSLVFRFRLGTFDFFDGGDVTWNVERQLVCPKDLVGPIDLYQVTHHGLDSSNHPTLVRTIAPTVAIMNNGPRKGGSPATVRLLKSIPSIEAAYQLHRNVATGPGDNTDPALIANSDPQGGQFVRVSVTPDGSEFSVRIGADGEPRTFRSR